MPVFKITYTEKRRYALDINIVANTMEEVQEFVDEDEFDYFLQEHAVHDPEFVDDEPGIDVGQLKSGHKLPSSMIPYELVNGQLVFRDRVDALRRLLERENTLCLDSADDRKRLIDELVKL